MNMDKLLNKNSAVISFVVFYRILLDYIYANYTSYIWGYAGFENHATTYSLIVSWLVLISLTLIVLPLFRNQDSFYPDLLILFFVMKVVPFTTIIRFFNTSNDLSVLYFVYFALTFLLTKRLKLRPVPLKNNGIAGTSDFILYAGLFFFAAIIIFISGYYAHFRIHLSFDDVYELRGEAKGFDLPLIIRYLWSPATNILPLLFAYFLSKKKKMVCLFILLIILLNFSINGMKSTFFKLLICVAFVLIKFNDLKKYYLPGFILLLLITILEGFIWDFHLIHDIVIRRVFFIPSMLDTLYYDYITQNGPMFYARGGTPIQYVISDIYFGDPEMESNNGLFSDAFMNLGVMGCFVYPVIYAFMFRFCGSAFRGAEKGLVIFAAIIMSYTLEGSELTTGLLTHGLFLFCVFLYLISMKTYKLNYWCPIKILTEPTEKGTNLSASPQRFVILRLLQQKIPNLWAKVQISPDSQY